MGFGFKTANGAVAFAEPPNGMTGGENSDGRAIVELVYDVETHELKAKRANGEEFVVFAAVPHSMNS